MVELFRVPFKYSYRDQLFEDRAGNELCTLGELQNNVKIPDGTKRFDVVGFQHYGRNRFKAYVEEDRYGLYFEVLVMGCNGGSTTTAFPTVTTGPIFTASNVVVFVLLKKLKKKKGDVVYLQIEY